jgi:HK97 family phage prohead protease
MDTVYIEATMIECNEEKREISGKIVPFGIDEIGSTNLGAYAFEVGSIEIADPSKIKLLSQHDMKKPVGRMVSAEEKEDGIYATFKLSRSQAGSDAMIMASEGLVAGLSIGAEITASKPSRNGYTIVSAAKLKEVSLVTEPAFKSAQVLEIAAEEVIPVDVIPTTESETVVEETTTVEAPSVEASAVEAARPTVTAMYYTTPRIEITAAKYMENKIQAALGSETARQYILAADNTTDNAGLVPTRQLAEVINGLGTTIRPSIDAISSGTLPDAGMTFEIPKITAMPTVAVTAEDAAFSDTDQNSAFLSVDVKKFAGQQKFSVELLTRTSPLFYDELLRNMVAAKAKAENAYVNGLLISNASLDATTTVTYPTAAELIGIVARGAASVYGATAGLANPFARNMIVSTGQWSNAMSLNDAGRPIYNASQPQNAGGVVTPTSLTGNIAGLGLYVDPTNGGDGDGTILVVNPDAYTWYQGQSYQLRAEATSDGSITVGIYSFGALAVKIAAGAFKNNKA